MGTGVVYPRFLGKDSNGDFVWELANGRWTWGDDPFQAALRQRTFNPDRYVEKYGAPEPLMTDGLPADVKIRLTETTVPAEVAEPITDKGGQLGAAGKRGAQRALRVLLEELDGWIEGQQANHQASPHRGENRGEECWRLWAPSDFRSMVNDAARRVGVPEFPVPAERPEDKELER